MLLTVSALKPSKFKSTIEMQITHLILWRGGGGVRSKISTWFLSGVLCRLWRQSECSRQVSLEHYSTKARGTVWMAEGYDNKTIASGADIETVETSGNEFSGSGAGIQVLPETLTTILQTPICVLFDT